jgi:hypothetical protein
MKKSGSEGQGYLGIETKKCPDCYTYLKADADRCTACGIKVGKRGKTGLATKPFNWKGYLIAVFAWTVFGLYIWWAFFRGE